MDQHPVPQNISSYEFRLVGDMTLKQFFQLAGGALLGFLFFKMPLPIFLKWPLIILSVALGIMLAFIPVGGRPFSQWLVAFFKAIYSPTEYTWFATAAEPMEAIQAPTPSKPASALDNLETQVFSRVSQLLQPAPKPPLSQTETAPPPFSNLSTPPPPPASTPPSSPQQAPASFAPPPPESAPPGNTTAPARLVVSTEIHSIASHQSAAPSISTPEVSDLPPAPSIAQSKPALSTPVYSASPVPMPPPPAPQAPAPQAELAPHLPAPERPNLVFGVVTHANQPVEGAIVEILNSANGIPVRALRSNKLGQFQTATPLSPGAYNITTEKEGLVFDQVSIVCQDKIVLPISIVSRA